MTTATIPPDTLRWLPGPICTIEHKAKATSRVARRLKKMAGNRRCHNPDTWFFVALELGIRVQQEFLPGEGRARLVYDSETDGWIIFLNTAYSRVKQACAMVHELAHYLFREELGEWLCDEPIVYYYEGSVDEQHHALSRDVERLVVQVWDEVPEGAGGLFEGLEARQ